MKKWLVALVLILGGVIMFFSLNFGNEKTSDDKYKQEIMTLYACNHYEDVQKIEFQNIIKDHSTGAWNSDAVINEEIYVKFTLFEGNNDVSMSELTSRNSGKSLVEKDEKSDNKTTDGIEIIFAEK